jgi:hypothetical protein
MVKSILLEILVLMDLPLFHAESIAAGKCSNKSNIHIFLLKFMVSSTNSLHHFCCVIQIRTARL